jgi:hypothetical protein
MYNTLGSEDGNEDPVEFVDQDIPNAEELLRRGDI